MAKSFFRFLRGELNGFYLKGINNSINKGSEDIKTFLTDFSKMQFNPDTMDSETIYNIGRFAGVYLPRLSSNEGYGALRLTESELNNKGKQRSERGLFRRDLESFKFVHLTEDEYANDINTLANTDEKSSLIGTEELEGYISSEEADVIDDEGNIKESAVTQQAPENVAYSDFYGNEFLFISDPRVELRMVDISLFYPLYKVMQYIRYNGANIDSFCKIIQILCPDGFIEINSIDKVPNAPYFTVHYKYNDEVEVTHKTQRLATFVYVAKMKFPQFILVEDDI